MYNAHGFLQTLAAVLCIAAVTTILFQRLKQPVVLGYLLAGMVVGPYIPIPIRAESHTVEELAELGVILLMFSLGIEFNLTKLLKIGATAGFVAILQCSLMLWLGYVIGHAFDQRVFSQLAHLPWRVAAQAASAGTVATSGCTTYCLPTKRTSGFFSRTASMGSWSMAQYGQANSKASTTVRR